MPEPLAGVPWRTIEQLERCVGAYCWQEYRLFELTGAWAGGEGSPGARMFFNETSGWRAFFAALWRDRLPARAGVHVPALMVAPSGAIGPALHRLEGASGPLPRLGGLMTVLCHLLAVYRLHLSRASAVSEAPVIDVLRLIEAGEERELDRGRLLLREEAQRFQQECQQGLRSGPGGEPPKPAREEAAALSEDLERLFAEASKMPDESQPPGGSGKTAAAQPS